MAPVLVLARIGNHEGGVLGVFVGWNRFLFWGYHGAAQPRQRRRFGHGHAQRGHRRYTGRGWR